MTVKLVETNKKHLVNMRKFLCTYFNGMKTQQKEVAFKDLTYSSMLH